MAEREEELNIFFWKLKEDREKVGLKLHIQETKIMVSCPITSWQIGRETVTDLILGGSKITADGDCRQEIKTLAPWKKKKIYIYMTNLDSILTSRNIT